MALQNAYLFSIAGLSVTLAGFSGLVSAFRRGGPWKPTDAFRLRQISEMGLATAFITLASVPFAEITDVTTAVRVASVVALIFTCMHAAFLWLRGRTLLRGFDVSAKASAVTIDLVLLGMATIGILFATVPAYEGVLVLMLARPMVAFALVLRDVPIS
jgi:hypothetical protein